jgi:hypothetical protein
MVILDTTRDECVTSTPDWTTYDHFQTGCFARPSANGRYLAIHNMSIEGNI